MHPLNNVIWNALTTRQTEFAESFGEARRFVPEVTSLAGFHQPTPEGYESLGGLLDERGTIALFLERPFEPCKGWSLVAAAPLLQMVCENGHAGAETHGGLYPEMIELGAADSPEMIALTTLTKPGPFNKRTHELGTYLGIRSGGELVAMAGERVKSSGLH